MILSAHGATHPGRRPSNEDALLVDAGLGLFVVADGMGGHNAGEVAARLATEEIRESIASSRDGGPSVSPDRTHPALSTDANRLRTAVRNANARVLRESSERAECAGMGTTVVAVLASDSRLAVVGVGDSRVYLWRGGTLEQITRDDSWVATVLAREPGMTDQALARHPMRHVLTSVIGARADTDPEVQEHEFGPGDILLLCSDGLHGAMDSSEAAAIFSAGGSVEEMTNALVHHALARGASDNVTAVVIRREA